MRVFPYSKLAGEYEGTSGFQVVGPGTLERWSWPGDDPAFQIMRVASAVKSAGTDDDPQKIYWLPRHLRRKKIQELREIAYRQRHQPRRLRPTKLTFAQCEEIKSRRRAGESAAAIARNFKVSATYVQALTNGTSRRVNWGEAIK